MILGMTASSALVLFGTWCFNVKESGVGVENAAVAPEVQMIRAWKVPGSSNRLLLD